MTLWFLHIIHPPKMMSEVFLRYRYIYIYIYILYIYIYIYIVIVMFFTRTSKRVLNNVELQYKLLKVLSR